MTAIAERLGWVPSIRGRSLVTRRAWAVGLLIQRPASVLEADPFFAGFIGGVETVLDEAHYALLLQLAGTRERVLSRVPVWAGVRVPAWLITQGADATSEALLGLAPYARATGSPAALRATRRLARGVAEFQAGSSAQWPFRALLPWAESLDDWHAWGAEMAQGLAAAASALGDRSLLKPAIGDTAGFTAQLLTATGPDNGWLPVPLEKVQIAYGADARVRACYEVGRVAGRSGIRRLAGWRRAGSSAPTGPGRRRTTRRPGSPSTASRRTGG